MSDIDFSEIYKLMRPRNICICKAVSEKTLIETIHSGAETLEELVQRTEASTKCGSCSHMIRNIFNREILKIQEERKAKIN